MERVEEFIKDGKTFVYIDFSGCGAGEIKEVVEKVEPIIGKHPPFSLYTITSIENVVFDSQIKEIFLKYMRHNTPYVKSGVVIGMDGIKKMMFEMICKLSGRKNMHIVFTKEQAIELLLRQD